MLKNNINWEARELFVDTLGQLKNPEEINEFMRDLFSSGEIKDFSRRLICSQLLFDGKTYQQIQRLMGMNPGTINKVHSKTKGSPLFKKLFK